MQQDIKTINNLITRHKRILIITNKEASLGAVSSALALRSFLLQKNKFVDVLSENFVYPSHYSFLEDIKLVKSKLPYLQKFMISVDISKTGIAEHRDEVQGDKLNFILTPAEGAIDRSSITVSTSGYNYDLIITIGVRDITQLGSMSTSNHNFFYDTPILNIDNNSSNESWGNINLVDITKSSTAEIIYELIQDLGDEHIDKKVALELLTGIIADTRAFKSKRVMPHTLRIAGELIALGADRKIIIDSLYHNQNISTLKLWGVALTQLKNIPNKEIVYTSLTREDFIRTGASETDIIDIIPELISKSPEAKIIIITHEHSQSGHIHAIIHTTEEHNLLDLLAEYQPRGDSRNVSFITKDKSLSQVEQLLIDKF